MNILLILNWCAAHVNHSRIDALEAAFIGSGHIVKRINSYDSHLIESAYKSDSICIAGGDGTVRDVLSRLAGVPLTARITVYPLGTINLVAREAHYVKDPRIFVDRATSPHAPRVFHTVQLNRGLMLVCASVGPDSAAVAGVSPTMKRRFRRFAYLLSALKLLYNWPRDRIQVSVDDEKYSCEAVYVLNGKYYAGPWQLDTEASLQDKSIRVLILPKARRRDYLRLIIATLVHPIFNDRNWKRMTASNVEISAAQPLHVQVDGDITANLPVKFAINPVPSVFA